MNCTQCTGNRFHWTGEFLKNGGDPHVQVEVECCLCGRKYQTAVPWENFQLTAKGKKPGNKNKKEEELVPLEEFKAFKESLIKSFDMPEPQNKRKEK